MKNSVLRVGWFARTSLLCFLGMLAVDLIAADAATQAAPAEPVASPPAPEPKSHTLFMGTDISIEYEKKLYRLQDVFSTNFIVSVDGQKTTIPMHGTPHNMKLEQSLKLTNVSASLTGLKADRAYTPHSDPRMRRQIEASRVANAIGDNASLAMGKFTVAENKFGVGINAEAPVRGAAESAANLDAAAAAASKEAFAAERMAEAQFNTDYTNAGLAQLRADSDLAKELFDAVEVNFEVSSPTELKSPYIVLVVRYHPRDKPGKARDMIYARALDAIGSNPQKVHILQGGLPPGYEIDSYQVHLYNLGQEVATDVVPKLVPLTREEAFEYVKAEYIGQHKGATLPSSPAMGKLGLKTRAQLTTPQLNGVYYVKVGKDGRPKEAFIDEACSQPVDSVIDSIVKNVRFFPALENGKSVDGVSRLTFSHLTH